MDYYEDDFDNGYQSDPVGSSSGFVRDGGRWCRKCLTVDSGYEILWICRD